MLLGDATAILKELGKTTNLRKAFRYALRDRHKEWFYDPFELEWATRNENTIIKNLARELRNPLNYEFKTAYAYFAPKTELCYRRMIYIPFQDLVVRYAFATVLADLLDADLSPKSFANRRGSDPQAERLFQDFATVSWPNFCEWQRTTSADRAYSTLLRTDISAFYDSISHEYLTAAVAARLKVPKRSKLIRVFRLLLQVRVMSYCHRTSTPRPADTMFQGLSIGNSTEGLFANIYLDAIDQYMARFRGIAFGRYNDDIRLFAKNRAAAKRAMLALQARLLTKGLNLNSSKTAFAEGEAAVEGLRSKLYEYDDYSDDEYAPRPPVTDRPFDEFNRDFQVGDKLEKAQDAKDFCLFLAHRLPLSQRRPAHIRTLKTILTKWHGSSKHATWRLAESFVRDKCPPKTRELAQETLLTCLADQNVANYSKYRLLHHLFRERQPLIKGDEESADSFRYCELLAEDAITELAKLLPGFLAEPAFELNIIALYAMRVLGKSADELQAAVDEHARKPVPVPIRNAILLARGPTKSKVFPAYVPISDEVAETEGNY